MAANKNSKDRIAELDPQLESAVWSVLSEPIDAEAVGRVRIRAQQLASSPPMSSDTTVLDEPLTERSANQGWASRLLTPGLFAQAIAASLIVAVGAILFLPSKNSSFGAVMEQLRAARAYSFVQLVYTDRMEQPIESRVYVSADGRRREELFGTSMIHDTSGTVRLLLIKDNRTALVYDREERAAPRFNQFGWFEELRSGSDHPDKRLGEKTLDGRQVEGFVVKRASRDFTIWIDAQTHELVQIEHASHVEGSGIRKVVYKDFKFDAELAESLFSLEVPDGYKVVRPDLPQVSITDPEKNIIGALRGFTELADGKFPKSIADWGEWAVLFAKNGKSTPQTTQVMGSLGAITPFLMQMSHDDYEYLGEGKTITDERTIVFWYRNREGVTRAVYNDLTVGDVDEKDLPQAEK